MKRSKLVGGRERKRVEKGKKDGPSLKRLSAPALTSCLSWQWVVVAFAALALAAEHNGSGQKEERGGNQQEQAEASKNPHNLHTDVGKKYASYTNCSRYVLGLGAVMLHLRLTT